MKYKVWNEKCLEIIHSFSHHGDAGFESLIRFTVLRCILCGWTLHQHIKCSLYSVVMNIINLINSDEEAISCCIYIYMCQNITCLLSSSWNASFTLSHPHVWITLKCENWLMFLAILFVLWCFVDREWWSVHGSYI